MVGRAPRGKVGKKKQEDPVVIPARNRRTTGRGNQAPSEKRNSLTTPKSINTVRDNLTTGEAMADSDEVFNKSDGSSDMTPPEKGRGTTRKRGDSEDTSASGNEIEDDDDVQPTNASATKFAIKKKGEKGETAMEVKGNAVAYMKARIAQFIKDTLFKMVKFILDHALSQIAMGLVVD